MAFSNHQFVLVLQQMAAETDRSADGDFLKRCLDQAVPQLVNPGDTYNVQIGNASDRTVDHLIRVLPGVGIEAERDGGRMDPYLLKFTVL